MYFHRNRNFNILGLTLIVSELQADGKDVLHKGRFKLVLPIIFHIKKKFLILKARIHLQEKAVSYSLAKILFILGSYQVLHPDHQ